MTAPIERTESIVLGGSTSALERSHNYAPAGGWRISPKNLDGVCRPAEGNNRAADLSGNRGKSHSKRNRVSDNFRSERRTRDHLGAKVVDTVTCCIKVHIGSIGAVSKSTVKRYIEQKSHA
jgi:hypothetical protein